MARTTSKAVEELLGDDFQAGRSLVPFIATANSVVSRVATCAAARGVTISTADLELIERWLAAHFYTKSDRTYSSRSTAGASGVFTNNPEVPEPYRDGAIAADHSGCLNAILNRRTAGAFWLGRAPSEQTDYADRD